MATAILIDTPHEIVMQPVENPNKDSWLGLVDSGVGCGNEGLINPGLFQAVPPQRLEVEGLGFPCRVWEASSLNRVVCSARISISWAGAWLARMRCSCAQGQKLAPSDFEVQGLTAPNS